MVVHAKPERIPGDAKCWQGCVFAPPDHNIYPCNDCVGPEYQEFVLDPSARPGGCEEDASP